MLFKLQFPGPAPLSSTCIQHRSQKLPSGARPVSERKGRSLASKMWRRLILGFRKFEMNSRLEMESRLARARREPGGSIRFLTRPEPDFLELISVYEKSG